jgi:glyoxylase-like metal-dependent hydrolase (beta-lactamase superfamily II)
MWPAGLHAIGGLLVHCHLLVSGGEAVLIDTGLAGTPRRLKALMERLELPPSALRAILLTHGHLDHVGGLTAIKAWSGARVFAHPAEQAHMDGTFAYRGVARVGGVMEAAGRLVLGQQSVKIDVPLRDGDELPFWGGLRVIHLPGHTTGHCGFFSARANVLFCGDLFASHWFSTHRSPAIFTSDSSLLPASMARVRAMNPAGLVPNHYDRCDAALHRRRFEAVVSDAG